MHGLGQTVPQHHSELKKIVAKIERKKAAAS
jgi:hypothetical protein